MRKLLLLILFCVNHYCQGQSLGNMITVNQVVPSQLTICGDAKLFTVTIYNPSPFLITSDTLFVTIPTGIQYQGGSLTGGTILNNFGGVLKVILPNIPTLTTHTVTFTANAQCNVLQFISGGGSIKTIARVTYKANNIYRYDTNTSSTFLIKQPNLTITSVSNQSYLGNIGDVFTRCITVVNGGFGELTTFTLTDIHAAGIVINSVNKGTLTHIGPGLLTAKVVLTGADFTSVGDGDNVFEGGESITICETVTVNDCISGISSFKAFWGCSVNACQSAVSSANVVFPNYVPNLVVTPTASMNSCLGPGNASPQQLRIINKGLGKAINVLMDIFQSTSSGFNPNLGSRIDETSFTIRVGISSTPVSIAPTSTQANSASNCVAGSTGKALITIPEINPGDTVYLNWNSYSCCGNACTGSSNNNVINGWRYKGTYTNFCQTNYVIYEAWGRTYSHIYGGLTPDGAPSTLSNGQTGTFNFLFSNYGNSYPVGPGAYWKFEFTLPNFPCISYSNIRIVHPNGTSTWVPSSTTSSGNVVTAIFSGAQPFGFTQAEVKIDLQLLCASCTGTEVMTDISVKSFYIPNNTCSCEIGVACQSIPFNINCPDPCPAGVLFSNFEMKRTSYGLPDNLNSNNTVNTNGGDGLPDGLGSLNFSKIKTNRAMFGDTITSVFYGVLNTNLAHPNFPYTYAVSSISNGNLLQSLNATLEIYRGGTLFLTCNNISASVTTSGTTREFLYDLSVPTNTCLNGHTNLQGDSIVLTCRYKDTVNIGNAVPLNCFSTNRLYSSEIANPTQASDKFQCGTINGNCTVIGYWFRNWDGSNYGVKSCDNNVITQNYHLSIGPGHTNDAGGNLFPYEYRNWAHVQNLTAIIPDGYSYISSRFMDVRTAGTLVTSNSGWITLTPVDVNSDTLAFNIEPYFQGYGGTIPLSDDGFYGVFEVTVQPSCEVTPGVEEDIEHIMDFETTSFISGSGSDTTTLSRNDDHIIYDAPDLFVQSPLPSILAVDSLSTWDLIISNSSNVADALNTWIGSSTTTGVEVVKVEDLDLNQVIAVSDSGIYHLGTVAAMGTRTFRITATHLSCNIDSVIVYCGWNCIDGYPTSVGSYPCVPETITLSLTPLFPGLIVDAVGPASPIQLCDTGTFIANGVNVQLGTAYTVNLFANLPPGAVLIPGSSQLSYPDSTPYVSIADPVLVGGNQWKWNVAAADSLMSADGLKGLLDTLLNSFRIKFRVSTGCGYISGNNINFNLEGIAACGDTTDFEIFPSTDLDIIGLQEPYSTAIKIVTTYISPCATNSTIKLVIENHGPTAFGATDSVSFKLPGGVAYVPGSFGTVHNSPLVGTPFQSTVGGSDYLTWKLPPGVPAGDSTVFTFQFSGEPVLLTCGIVYFETETKSASIVTCSVTGQDCATNIVTGDTSLAIFIYKAYLAFGNGSATSIPNPPGGETVTMTFDIINTGQAISINADSVIQYYFDADGNGVYSIPDIYIAQDTVLVPKDSTITYTTTFDAPAGHACSILAVVDPSINNCVCDPTQTVVQSRLLSFGNDTAICSGETLIMSYAPVTGYTYTWTPTTDLSDGTASDAVFSALNNTTNPISTTYTLATDRIGCSGLDTITITVNPLPTATISGAVTVCKGAPSPEVVFVGAIGPAPYTFTYMINGVDTQTVVSTGDTAVVMVPTDSIGVYTYTLISVEDSSLTTCLQLQSDSIKVTVNPLPTATIAIGGAAEVCEGGSAINVIIKGSGGVSPYTFTYSINDGTPQIINSSSGDSAVVLVPTAVADTFVYKVINVRDASVTLCSQLQNDSVIVIINPLPTATITGSTVLCRDAVSPLVTFVGTAGADPFTFSYTINNGATQTVTSTNGDTAFVLASTSTDGSFVYKLTGVTDASSTICYQPQNDSITIVVEPLPTATIHGTDTLCQYSLSQGITFVGVGGVAPYTFNYSLNGVQQAPVTTVSGDSITIPAPTNVTGVFTYVLESVTDANIVACTHPQTGDAVITINTKPVAQFTANNVCNGNATQFTDGSNTATGTITSWSWDLDDGSPLSTSQNPFYIYANAGIYNVTLIVNNNFNCQDTLADSVEVYFNPVVGFTHSDVCLGDTVHFANASSVDPSASITGYIWVFGDGSPTSNLTNPVHYYTNAGTYNVTLVATTAEGCSGVANVSVKTFDPPVSNFQFSNTCLYYPASFTNTSVNPTMGSIASWSWNFGDGTALETGAWNPTHLYSIPGEYELTLITHSTNLGCPDTLKDSIVVFPMPVADFSAEDVCLLQTMSFYDSTTVTVNSVTNWEWNFGDGSPLDTIQNPTHTFADATTYTVQLITTTTNGCRDTITQNVVVHPLPLVNYNTANVCDGNTVYFNDATSIPTTDTLDSWSWNFGDTSAISTAQNTSHLFDTAGSYTVQLIVVSTFGCVDSLSKVTVVNPNPLVSFVLSDTAGCEPFCVTLMDSSLISTGGNTLWTWNYGDGSPAMTGDTTIYCYSNDSIAVPVQYSVTLTVTSDSGCVTTLSKPNSITVYPKPFSNFIIASETITIINPVISITDLSIGADYWSWDFGDTDTSSSSGPSIYHEYTDTGSYTLTLITSTQYGCKDTSYQNTTIEPDFVFYVPNAFTPNDDGINDSFSGKGIFIIKYEMMIFDRWGNLIFFSDDYNKSWDGRANNGEKMAQRDVYVYKIRVTDIYQMEHFYTGTVTLVE